MPAHGAIYAHKRGLSKTDLPNAWFAAFRKAANPDDHATAMDWRVYPFL